MTIVLKPSSCSWETPFSRFLLCGFAWGFFVRFLFFLGGGGVLGVGFFCLVLVVSGFVFVFFFFKYPLESPSWNTGPAFNFQPYSSPLKESKT